MKQFIVLMAVLPILLIFMVQIGYDQRTGTAVDQIQAIVYGAKEQAKQDGCFTEENIKKVKADIAEAAGVDSSEVEFVTENEIKYRYADTEEGRLIYYRVAVPMKNVMAGAGIFGISDRENSYTYVIDSYTASERI